MYKKVCAYSLGVGLICTVGYLLAQTAPEAVTTAPKNQATTTPAAKLIKKLPDPVYSAQNFPQEKFKGLSFKQINSHLELYQGYVDKRNDLVDMLKTVNLDEANNRSYSAYRSLKLAEIYTMNADILHRLYFQNITNKQTKPGPQTLELIIQSFGSVTNFKNDFFAAGMSGHGWVMTGYSLDDKRIHNYILEAHNQSVPVLTLPVLVMDVYEHAYMIDFGIKRWSYIDLFWQRIDWDVVEERINTWVNPLRQQP